MCKIAIIFFTTVLATGEPVDVTATAKFTNTLECTELSEAYKDRWVEQILYKKPTLLCTGKNTRLHHVWCWPCVMDGQAETLENMRPTIDQMRRSSLKILRKGNKWSKKDACTNYAP